MTNRAAIDQPPGFPRQAIWFSVLCAFFLSGAASLIHEVVWIRLLRLVMGNTTYTITTVLCAFMGGLALGGYVGGRIIDRRNDALRVFAIMEGVIGLYCLLLPWLLVVAEPLYRSLYQNTHTSFTMLSLIRFTICSGLLLLPATLMGATLPVLSRYFVRSKDCIGRPVGALYAINTFGAVLGAGAAGLFLIPKIGVSSTIWVGATMNLAVCAAGFWIHHRTQHPSAAGARVSDSTPAADGTALDVAGTPDSAARLSAPYGRRVMVALLIGYGLSGLAALVYQIAWTRVLSLLIGSSAYAFSLIVTAFILGLALGSMIFSRWVDRVRDPLRALAIIQMAIALSALVVVPVFGELPIIMTGMIARLGSTFWLLQFAEFGIVFAIMLVPTSLMGAAFPLVSRVYANEQMRVGRSVGTVYACNTVGSIVGSFIGGFMLIPLLGIENTILVAVSINLVVGCLFLLLSRKPAMLWRSVGAGTCVAAAVVMMVMMPGWDPNRMSFGPFVQAAFLAPDAARSPETLRVMADESETVFHKEGLSATVTVKKTRNEEGEVLMLLTNGRVEAASPSGARQQKLLAHIPLLLHPDPEDALVIGLASGVTLGSAGLHPLETIDCAELSSEVIEATRLFAEYNHRILDDPRVRILVTDGRNHVSLTDKRYDVIVSQPSDPATAGVGDLFTLEFFNQCHRCLNDEGILCVWLSAAAVDPDAFRGVVRSFNKSFENTTIWTATGHGEFLLVGSKAAFSVSHRELARRMNRPEIARDLSEIQIETIPDLFSHMVTSRQGAVQFSEDATLHTDDNALLEFSSPKGSFYQLKNREVLVDDLLKHRTLDLSMLVDEDSSEVDSSFLLELRAESARFIRAREGAYWAEVFLRAGRMEECLEQLRQAAALNPTDPFINRTVATIGKTGAALVEAGDIPRAIKLFQEIAAILPDSAKAHVNLAQSLQDVGQPEGAIVHFREALRINPDDPGLYYSLANVLQSQGKVAEAIENYQLALQSDPEFADAHRNLGLTLQGQGKIEAAIGHFQQALRSEPEDASTHASLGLALKKQGKIAEAIEHYRKALRSDPDFAETHNNLGNALQEQGQIADAIKHYQRAVQLKPNYGEAHFNLAGALHVQGKIVKAIEHYSHALRIIPNNPMVHARLGDALRDQGNFSAAARHYAGALDLNPDFPPVLNKLAWIRATHPDGKIRNGAEAVALAERCCQLTRNQAAPPLLTLAAAYAEVGRFEDAIRAQQRAIELTPILQRAPLIERLALYEAKAPYREEAWQESE